MAGRKHGSVPLKLRRWVFSVPPDGRDHMNFCGTEEEMEKAATSLMERFRRNGYGSVLMVWTGHGWTGRKGPYCKFDESGKHILGATA